eukprot:758937-Hanusia_phi.AAC.3
MGGGGMKYGCIDWCPGQMMLEKRMVGWLKGEGGGVHYDVGVGSGFLLEGYNTGAWVLPEG